MAAAKELSKDVAITILFFFLKSKLDIVFTFTENNKDSTDVPQWTTLFHFTPD